MSLPKHITGACQTGIVMQTRVQMSTSELTGLARRLAQPNIRGAATVQGRATKAKEMLREHRTELEAHQAECVPCAKRIRV